MERHVMSLVPGKLPDGWVARSSVTFAAHDGRAQVIAFEEPIDSDVDSGGYARRQEEVLRTELNAYREIEFSASPVFGGRAGFLRVFEGDPPEQGAPRVRRIQACHASGGRGYTATATAAREEFAKVEPVLRAVIEGLTIADAPADGDAEEAAFPQRPPFSEPVNLLLHLSRTVQSERGDPALLASHVLTAFLRRHQGMLERLAGGSLDAAGVEAALIANDEPAAGLLESAGRQALEAGDPRADLRHVGSALVARIGKSSAPRDRGAPHSAAEPRLRRRLVQRQRPVLDKVGRNLSALAGDQALLPIVGRDDVIEQLTEILCRRVRRNALLVGPAGIGKTAVIEGLAQRLMRDDCPPQLADVDIVEVSIASMIARAPSLPELTQMVESIVAEARQSSVILFIDEFQAAVEVGGRDLGIAGQLKPVLARGQIACIGALTESDYFRTVESDPALDRRFEPVRIAELGPAAAVEVLRALVPTIAPDVAVPDATLEAAVRLSGQYLRNRHLPDKAIDVLDRVVARARRQGGAATPDLVADAIAAITGLPLGSAAQEIGERVTDLGDALRSRIVGQDEAIAALTEHLALKVRNLDLKPERPNGVFLFTGPTGVGKTEMARVTAEHLFGSADRMVRLDMSEYREEHYIAKLVGSPPGYVGYDQGAPLLEEVASRPFAVVLLDEVEKAHPAVHRYFLQVFEDGFLTSGAGKRIYFSDAVIIMTANVDTQRQQTRPGFTGGTETVSALDALDDYFPPEFVNRIDAVCRFRHLEAQHVKRIVSEITLRRWQEQHSAEGLRLDVSDAALEHLAAVGYSRQLGARELHRTVERELLNQIPTVVAPGEQAWLSADLKDGTITLERKDGESH